MSTTDSDIYASDSARRTAAQACHRRSGTEPAAAEPDTYDRIERLMADIGAMPDFTLPNVDDDLRTARAALDRVAARLGVYDGEDSVVPVTTQTKTETYAQALPPTPAPAVVVAELDTGTFVFQGVGVDEANAVDLLRKAWATHRSQYVGFGVPLYTWAELVESVQVRTLRAGEATRDREPLIGAER